MNRAVIGIVFTLTLVACGVTKGVVIAKHDYPAHEEEYTRSIYAGESCYRSGQSEVCSPHYIYMPAWRHVDEYWTLTIKDPKSGDTSEETVDVTAYRKAHLGDVYDTASRALVPQ